MQRHHFPIRVNLAQLTRHPGDLIVRYSDQKKIRVDQRAQLFSSQYLHISV
jgi:hypothetical protein